MPISFEVSSNSAEVAGWLRTIFRDQLPFSTAVALNRTSFDARDAIRAGMERRFTIRRQWVLWGIAFARQDRATKTKLEARIHVDPRRDFLVKFEEGDPKRPREGTRLAIPGDVKRTGTGVVSKTEKPRAFGFEEVRPGFFVGAKRTFMLRKPGGRGGIFQRQRGGGLRRLYGFAPVARTPELLEFEATAGRVVRDKFDAHFARAFDRAIATAR